MTYGDLVIEIKIKEKGKIISKIQVESNNDILDMKQSGMMYLEKRIGDIGYKISKEVNSKRINPGK